MTDAIKMQLSAFVDGELSDAESELLIRRIGRDAELRAIVAEYHAIGRIMRAEAEPAGMERLLAAVREGIDSDTPQADTVAEAAPASRLTRPLAGIAVAASVALAGVIGVSQWSPTAAPAAETASTYTTPSPEMQEFYERHLQSGDEFNPFDSIDRMEQGMAIPVTAPISQRDVDAPGETGTTDDADDADKTEESVEE